MEEIKVYIDGKEKSVGFLSEHRTILDYGDKHYEDNPTVGVLVNGKLSSLSERIDGKAELESVPLFSPLGKRIYRRTLTLLLSYASSLIYPMRPLVIGHSLGDGYFFRYDDHGDFSISALEKEMRKIVEEKTEIEKVRLSHDDALSYAEKTGEKETRTLLESINASGYDFIKCGSYYQLYTEPVLPDFSIVTLWELRRYGDGLLLRYPQSRSIERIMPFSDNPLLFAIFEESRKNEDVLDIHSIGELNESIAKNTIARDIRLMEAQQRRKIIKIADMILNKSSARIIFIAGPSSSGKTTFSLKLCDELSIMGKKAIKISLDDYYKPRCEVPRDESGDYDYEVLEALRLDLFREQITSLLNGEDVHLPSFSFIKQETVFSKESYRMDKDTYLVIEGISDRLLRSRIRARSRSRSVRFRSVRTGFRPIGSPDGNRTRSVRSCLCSVRSCLCSVRSCPCSVRSCPCSVRSCSCLVRSRSVRPFAAGRIVFTGRLCLRPLDRGFDAHDRVAYRVENLRVVAAGRREERQQGPKQISVSFHARTVFFQSPSS